MARSKRDSGRKTSSLEPQPRRSSPPLPPSAFGNRPERQQTEAGQQERRGLGDELEGHVVHDEVVARPASKTSGLTAKGVEIETVNVQIVERKQGWVCCTGDYRLVVNQIGVSVSLDFDVQVAVPYPCHVGT